MHDGDVGPRLHLRGDQVVSRRVVRAQEFERAVGEHYAEAEGRVRAVLLDHADLPVRVPALGEVGEVQTSGPGASDQDLHLSGVRSGKKPVPRLVREAVSVARWKREEIAESRRVAGKPMKCSGALELRFQSSHTFSRDIDRTPGMVLAVSGRRAYAENCFQRDTFFQLGSHNLRLAIDASEGGHDVDSDPVGCRRAFHAAPGASGSGYQEMLFPAFFSLRYDQFGRLGLKNQGPCHDSIERNL